MNSSSTPRRRRVLYVTIDPHDHRAENGSLRGHQANLAQVRKAVETWRPGAEVADAWCGRLDPPALDDPELVALFLSGSFTEWVEARRQPEWMRLIEAFSGLIRSTSVPILAVCGSHQFVAYAFGGWDAVGHMASREAVPVSIGEETDGVFRAPNPRLGEVGTFLYRRERSDPIFDGLTDEPNEPLIFSQWHYDQVLSTAMPAGAVSLMRPDGLARAVQNRQIDSLGSVTVTPGQPAIPYSHRAVETVEECCKVQALRYDVPPAGRILYTTQFHPDLAGLDSTGREDHGIAFIQNFLRLAADYWAPR